MNDVLEPPGTVLVAGVADDWLADVRDGLAGGAADDLRVVGSTRATVETVSRDSDVACLVLGDVLADASLVEVCRSVDSIAEELPIVVVAGDDDASFVRSVVRAGATDVVHPTEPVDRLRDVVDDAIESYRRRRVEAEESEMLAALLESLGKSIYFKDTDARHVHLADVAGGFDPAEARGKTDVELYGDDEPELARQALEDDRRVIEDRTRVVDRDEQLGDEGELWMRTTKVPWTDEDGAVRGLIGHTINVTQFKQTELQLAELTRRFESFTSRMGHDVKTPLQVASGYLDIARKTGDSEPIANAIDALERIDDIVDDYSTLTQRASKTEDLSPAELRSTVTDVWRALDAGDTRLVLNVEDDTFVNATVEMVRPIVENLLKNAVTHAGDDVTVRVGTTEDGFYVEDTGKGIPESERDRVLETGYTTSSDGSGRGLGIVTDEMNKHVWSLSVGESPEGGARFEVQDCLFDAEGDPAGTGTVELDQQDAVGTLERGGDTTYDEEFDRWSVKSDGTDVYLQNNDFYYVHAAVEGPVSVRGKVANVEYVDDYSKGGFMVRGGLDPAASYGYIGKTPGHGTEVLWRRERGADGESHQLEERAFTFHWYRIDRVGDELTLYLSLDGERWQGIARERVALSDPVHVGMVVCSCHRGQQCETVFENVRVTRFAEE